MCCGKKAAVEDAEGSAIIFKPAKDRKCTDCIFCILFLVFWVVMVAIAGIAFSQGNTDRLLYGSDYQGRICGSDEAVASKKFVYYPRIVEDIVAFAQSGTTNPLDIKLYGVCLTACPAPGDVTCSDEGRAALNQVVTAMGGTTTDYQALAHVNTLTGFIQYSAGSVAANAKGQCWVVPLKTKDYFYRCLWQRDALSYVNETCLTPDHLKGVDLSTAPKDVKDACITKRRTDVKQTEGEASGDNPVIDQMFNAAEQVGRYIADVKKAQTVILVTGGVLSVVCGFLFLVFMRRCAGCAVWTTIFLCILMLIIGTFFAYWKAGIIGADDLAIATDTFTASTGVSATVEAPGGVTAATTQDLQTRWTWFAYIITAVTLIVIALTIAWRTKIKIAIAVIKEASDAVRRVPAMLLLPIVTTVLVFILVIYFIAIASLISSAGDISTDALVESANSFAQTTTGQSLLCPVNATTGQVTNDTSLCGTAASVSKSFQSSSTNNVLLAIHFFGFLWTNQFINGVLITIIAGIVSRYYFTKDKTGKKPKATKGEDGEEIPAKEETEEEKQMRLPNSPVKEAAMITFKNHLGSIAFGSLVIAIVQFIRAVLEYLNKQSQEAQKKNMVLRILFKVLRCCLWCFEKCIKFLTSYAYIIVAMQGKSFCKACVDVVKMILSNPVQIGLVNTITTALFWFGKIAIVCFCGFVAFQWFDNDSSFGEGGENQLEGWAFPMLLIILFAFAIATIFMNVFSLSVDTILLCFLVDREKNNGESMPYYMSDNLKRAIGASTKSNKKVTGEESSDEEEDDKKTAGGAETKGGDDNGGLM